MALRWLLITSILPNVLAATGAVGQRYIRHFAFASLLVIASFTMHAGLIALTLQDTTVVDDLMLLASCVFLVVEAIRALLIDHYWINVRGHAVPRLIINLGEGVVYVTLALSLSSTFFHLNLTPILATSAVLSAVIGLALQDTLGSLFAGLSLHADQPYRPGDWVEILGYQGEVMEMSWRSTKLQTRRNELVVLPNNQIAKSEILNYSRPTASVERNVYITLSYDLAPNDVRRRILDQLAGVPGVLADPAPDVRVFEFEESGVNYQLVYRITDFHGDMRIAADIRRRLWYLTQRSGMGIPYPTRTVHVHQADLKVVDTTGDIMRAFGGVDFLAELPGADLAALAQRAKVQSWGADETLFRQGDDGDDFFIVVDGRLRVDVQDEVRGAVTVARLGPGDFVGEMSFLTGARRMATVVCETDTNVLHLGRSDFLPIVYDHPDLMVSISTVLAERAEANQTRVNASLSESQAQDARFTVTERRAHFLTLIRGFFNFST